MVAERATADLHNGGGNPAQTTLARMGECAATQESVLRHKKSSFATEIVRIVQAMACPVGLDLRGTSGVTTLPITKAAEE
jgi:hypothetical protein